MRIRKRIRPKEKYYFVGWGGWAYSVDSNGAYLYWGDKVRLAYMGRFASLRELKLSLLKQRLGMNFRRYRTTKKGCAL